MKKITTIIRDRRLVSDYLKLIEKDSQDRTINTLSEKYNIKGATVSNILEKSSFLKKKVIKKCNIKIK